MAVALPVFEFTRISRKYLRIPVSAAAADGTVATLTGFDVALVPIGGRVDSSTVWTAATFAAGVGTILLAGPDADPTGALAIPAAGADLCVRVTDSPEVDVAAVCRLHVS